MAKSNPLDATTRTLAFQHFANDTTTVTFVEHLTPADDAEGAAVRGISLVELGAEAWRKLGAPSKITITVAAADEA